MTDQYFPLGIADGQAFLGRESESEQLANNIKKNWHTLLLAPRRYGKTSLVKHVIHVSKLPAREIDLFLASDELAIEQKILKGIKELINETSDTPEQWFKELINYFKNANKKWSVGIKGFGIELEPENHHDIAENINQMLQALEMILQKQEQKAILFIDEIQEIANVNNSKAIEGALRYFAQQSKYLVFIFSGSNQHMLQHMFSDHARPLYGLCERITLERLPELVYQKYLNKIAVKTFGEKLSEEVFCKIIQLTERHSRTVYALCGHIWDYQAASKKVLTAQVVEQVWDTYIQARSREIRALLSTLSVGQLKVLTLIAHGQDRELTGKAIQLQLNLTSSAIVQGLQVLEEKGYIEQLDDKAYRAIDPIVKGVLVKYM